MPLCKECGGRGYIKTRLGPGGFIWCDTRRDCPKCHGTGELYVPADTIYPQPAEYPPCDECKVRAEEGPDAVA